MFFLIATSRLMKWAPAAFFLLWVSAQSMLAHSSDFVFARWSQDQTEGSVELSLSIQISDNPNIDTREQAVEVLTSLMQVRMGVEGEFVPMADVAKASFVDEVSFPQDSPVPIGGAGLEALESGAVEEEKGTEHEILTLKWTWKPAAEAQQMSFFLPDDCEQNVVFWWAEAQLSDFPVGEEVPWQIMLGGDESFPVGLSLVEKEKIRVTEATKIGWEVLLLIAAVSMGVFLFVGRARAK